MRKYIYLPLFLLFFIATHIFVAVCLVGCANRGIGPQGGPKDTIPPVIVEESPANGTVNFQGNQIVLTLNEYVQLDQPAKYVFVSPPQLKAPDVKAVGKRVTVTFDSELLDSTTYTIDFGAAICDYNERNPLRDYSFSFATGPEIDTLILEGTLIDARTLNPIQDVYVGIQRNLHDSAFSRIPFTRVARTNERGEFCIRNIHMGQYRLYALNDFSHDYLYQPGEGIAVYDSLVTPYPAPQPAPTPHRALPDSLATDSLTIDTLTIDTLAMDSISLLLREGQGGSSDTLSLLLREGQGGSSVQGGSSKLFLRYFVENKKRHYFVRCAREEQHFFTLYFSAAQDSVPVITYLSPQDTLSLPLMEDQGGSENQGESIDSVAIDTLSRPLREGQGGSSGQGGSPFYIIANPTNDTIVCWLTDSTYIRQDTISFLMTYQMSDSLLNLVAQTDTVNATYRPKRLTKKAQEALDRKRQTQQFISLSSNIKAPFDIYATAQITSKTPLRSYDEQGIHLVHLVGDSVSEPIEPDITLDSISYNRLYISYPWQAEANYKLTIDSAALIDIYGSPCMEVAYSFKVRSLDEYSTLVLNIEPYDPRAVIEVLSDKDEPVRALPAQPEGTRFEYLAPVSYYIRLFIDEDGNGRWTTGDWERHTQPEQVYYFSSKLTLRANWDFEETFHYLDTPLLQQKPAEIRKASENKKK